MSFVSILMHAYIVSKFTGENRKRYYQVEMILLTRGSVGESEGQKSIIISIETCRYDNSIVSSGKIFRTDISAFFRCTFATIDIEFFEFSERRRSRRAPIKETLNGVAYLSASESNRD